LKLFVKNIISSVIRLF